MLDLFQRLSTTSSIPINKKKTNNVAFINLKRLESIGKLLLLKGVKFGVVIIYHFLFINCFVKQDINRYFIIYRFCKRKCITKLIHIEYTIMVCIIQY